MTHHILIIGAGQAGLQAAISLRQAGFDGPVTLIGAEDTLPYQRPPLSKAYLKGEMALDRLLLRPDAFFQSQNITLRLNSVVEGIDRASQTVTLVGGETLSYHKLLIATGAPPRRLPLEGADASNVYYLRTLKDSDKLRNILEVDGRIVIVGAGYIGLEVAAVARAAGRDVTVLEMADRVLSRMVGNTVSNFFQNLHRGHGVDLRLGAQLCGFTSKGGRVVAARLGDGEEIPCAAVLVGIGAAPDQGLAVDAGLKVENGIWVDESARTEDPAIWAAGDISNFPSPFYGCRFRLESVPNAIEQGKTAGLTMAGKEHIYDALPWFWSDQYDVKLQTVGCLPPADSANRHEIVRGDAARAPLSVWTFVGDELRSVDAINEPAAFLMGKRLIAARTKIDAKKLADPATELKSLM